MEVAQMSESESNRIDRRDFVKRSVALAGTAFCFSVGLREAIAGSRLSGAPLLTAANLNQKFAQARAAGTLRAVAANIKNNPIGWLRANYSLTDIQAAALKSIPEPHWTEIKRVLTFVENNRGASLSVAISESTLTGTAAASSGMKCRASVKVTAEAQVGPATIKAEANAETT
jgi:hypothetical protein